MIKTYIKVWLFSMFFFFGNNNTLIVIYYSKLIKTVISYRRQTLLPTVNKKNAKMYIFK